METNNKLLLIQSELKAPKNQTNAFGKYKYRSCEDILEAVKPLLLKHDCFLAISDEVKEVAGNLFIESTVTLKFSESDIKVKAQAGIDMEQKGMNMSQRYGASSSYARKYALNGLFLIDDTKDADATNTHGKEEVKKADLTATTLKSMLEAITSGKGEQVKAKLGNYNINESQMAVINLALKNNV
jgi:hypothetical protein